MKSEKQSNVRKKLPQKQKKNVTKKKGKKKKKKKKKGSYIRIEEVESRWCSFTIAFWPYDYTVRLSFSTCNALDH